MNKQIPKTVLKRLPSYLACVKKGVLSQREYVSSSAIASALGLGEVLVRKDLALISGAGKPKLGYLRTDLVQHISEALGCTVQKNAIVVGAGRLGVALLEYSGFSEYDINIEAGFDSDAEKIGKEFKGKRIYSVKDIKNYCLYHGIQIGIITVPAASAQEACDILVESGIRAIWNFAPIKLNTPEGVTVKSENMAASLAVLASNIN